MKCRACCGISKETGRLLFGYPYRLDTDGETKWYLLSSNNFTLEGREIEYSSVRVDTGFEDSTERPIFEGQQLLFLKREDPLGTAVIATAEWNSEWGVFITSPLLADESTLAGAIEAYDVVLVVNYGMGQSLSEKEGE